MEKNRFIEKGIILNKDAIFSFFSEKTNKFYKLENTNSWPLLEISGIKMHFSKNISVKDSVQKMTDNLQAKGIVLDCCTGLGYCAILLARNPKVQKVHSFEIDENVLETAKHNSFSTELFKSKKISLKNGDVCEEILKFPKEFFDSILLDPPSFLIAKNLYSEKFYTEIFRVLKHGGNFLHYFGSPGIVKGNNFKSKVFSKLENIGFKNLEFVEEIKSVKAVKP
ncbi:MAG: methyltransferase domain-containing protein [Candidatus Diapherotrites archaeon]|nr:methyltransferase domain-containing protein [Candidatus Diapherotrites archaeon]